MLIGQFVQVLAALFSSKRLSLGGAMSLSMTVVSTMILSVLLALSMPPLHAASLLTISRISSPSSPIRFLQRVKLEIYGVATKGTEKDLLDYMEIQLSGT